MGKALAEAFPQARAVLAEVDEALGQNLSELMFEGPPAELTLTANAQPALMAVSLAAVRVLEGEAGLNLARDAGFVAGHSLGEYSALAAAGSLGVGAAAKLLRVRGHAMQEAVPVGTGAMAALLGLDYDAALAIAKQAADETGGGAICEVANDNGGGQVVVSGSRAAVHRAIEIAKARGARRSILLPVSAPFHCALMQPAAEAMAAALATANIQPPCVAARRQCPGRAGHRSGRDPQASRRPGDRRGALARKHGLHGEPGNFAFVECGAGKVLAGLVKRIAGAARGVSIGIPADIDLYQAMA